MNNVAVGKLIYLNKAKCHLQIVFIQVNFVQTLYQKNERKTLFDQ